MIDRRSLVVLLASAVAGIPLIAKSQSRSDRPFRVGILSTSSPEASNVYNDVLIQGLLELGYVEGRDIRYEYRFAGGNLELLPGLASELVRLPSDLIVAGSPAAIRALKQATQSIPIVMTAVFDPVAEGFIESLSRPGGNITGLAYGTGMDNIAKRLQLLKELLPGLSKLGALSSPAGGDHRAMMTEVARKQGVEAIVTDDILRQEQIDEAFAFIVRHKCDAFLDAGGSVTFRSRQKIADLALAHRLPGIVGFREYAVAGLLVTHGPNLFDLIRRSAVHVDKILRGANPAELPVELPARFDTVINMKTAKALGVRVPHSILLRATEIIE